MIRIATLCLAAYWLAIFVATHLPKSSMPSLQWSDKAYHAIAFSGLAFLLCWALPSRVRWKHAAIVLGLASTYAVFDEVTQQLIPGRTYDIQDIFADITGVCIGITAYTIVRLVLSRTSWGKRIISLLSGTLLPKSARSQTPTAPPNGNSE